jgi:hypothetical protein
VSVPDPTPEAALPLASSGTSQEESETGQPHGQEGGQGRVRS